MTTLDLGFTYSAETSLPGLNRHQGSPYSLEFITLVQIYGSQETKAFCCHCKKVTLHKYQGFSSSHERKDTSVNGFFSGLFAAIASALMEGQATGDYQCTACGTSLHTPDHLG